ncbi:MAG: phytanoyl-CoA dioxygenase family protein [Bryobacteraceae bacterium]
MGLNDAGYTITGRLFSVEECDRLIALLVPYSCQPDSRRPAARAKSRAGARNLLTDPEIAALALDPRMLGLARPAAGETAIPIRATLFDKNAAANWLVPWHQDLALPLNRRFDAPGWGPWSRKAGILYAIAPAWALASVVALRLHLDDCSSGNGALRVAPGSHAAGVLTGGEIDGWVRRTEPVECPAAKGTVIAMRPLLIHRSSKISNGLPRRVLHIEYAPSLDLAGRLDGGVRLALA